jgi:hypothetical protein
MLSITSEIYSSTRTTLINAEVAMKSIENDLRRILTPHFRNVYGDNYKSKLNQTIELYVKLHGSDIGPLMGFLYRMEREFDNTTPLVYSYNLVRMLQSYIEVEQDFNNRNQRYRQEQAAREAEEKKLREREEQVGDYITAAKKAEQNGDYESAIKHYRNALGILPTQDASINESIKSAQKMQVFLLERETKVYDFKELKPKEYDALNDSLTSRLRDYLIASEFDGKGEISIAKTVDYEGKSRLHISSSLKDKALDFQLRNTINRAKLQPVLYGYNVSANAEFYYQVRKEAPAEIEVTKKNDGSLIFKNDLTDKSYEQEITRLMMQEPSGKYTWELHKATINQEDFFNSKVLKYKKLPAAFSKKILYALPIFILALSLIEK